MRNGEYNLSAEELRRIVVAAPTARERVLLQLLAETGIRRSEAAALAVGDILWQKRLILIRSGKGGRSRLVPMTAGLASGLRELVGTRASGPVFRSRSGLQLSLRQINRLVAQAGDRAGVRNPNPRYAHVTCHLFRHSFARLWKLHGGSLESLSKILGHASVKTTLDVYGTESLTDVQENYARTIAKIAKWNAHKN